MLIIMDKQKIFRYKKANDGIMIEPSELANNFIVKKAHKLGVIKSPEWLLEKVEKGQEVISINLDIDLLDLFRRPNYGNISSIIEKGLEQLKEGKNVLITPQMFLILLDYLIQNQKDMDFDIDVDNVGGIDALKQDIKIKFIPYILERLLKLFSILYKEDIKQIKNIRNPLKLIAKVQLNLVDLNFKGDLSFFYNTNFKILKTIIEEVAKKYNFSTNNLFNKILEEIEKAIYVQQEQMNIELTDKANLVILFAKKESPLNKFI